MQASHIKLDLQLHGIPVNEADIPYIQNVIHAMNQAQAPLNDCQDLHKHVPLVVVDPEVIQFD